MWRTFAARATAERYALACWLRLLRRRAAEGDGTLRRIVNGADTGVRERVVDEWPDDHEAIRAWLASLTTQQLVDLHARIAGLPLLGRRQGALVIGEGHTLRWDVPRQTADGRWAVECPPFDTGGGPEPEWPATVPLA